MSALPSAAQTFDREFLTIRARLIDVAATLDRIHRAEGSPEDDPRWPRLRQAMELLAAPAGPWTEPIQMLFSLPYDPDWQGKRGQAPFA